MLNVLKIDKASNFFFKKYTQVFLLRSFIKVMKYVDPKNDGVENEPQRSIQTNFSTSLAFD
jgi:hypothetical protein